MPGMAMSSSTASGASRLDQAQRGGAVRGGAGDRHALDPGEQQLKPLDGERLVVDEEEADRLSHRLPFRVGQQRAWSG